MKEKEIYTSVITSSSYSSTYSTLYNKTGGIYANIYSSDFKSEMLNLADSIIEATARKMELKLSEPRLLYNLTVCYLANDNTSRSEDYKSSLKRMLNEYANDIAETSDGHVLINKVCLFSTDDRLNFFDTDNFASMADIQIQTREKDDGKWWNNVTIHTNAHPSGFYFSDEIPSSVSIQKFTNLKDESRYANRNGFRRIQMSGSGVSNYKTDTFTNDPFTYAETLTHESGHYVFGLFDEYLDKDGSEWGVQYTKPYSEYGLMDHQNDDIEMSKAGIDYSYFGASIPNNQDNRHTNQSYQNHGSCEDTLATLIEKGTGLFGQYLENTGNYVATYSKVNTSSDRRASYSYAGLSESDYVPLPGSGGGIRAMSSARTLSTSSVSPEYFDDYEKSETLIGNCAFSASGSSVVMTVIPVSGKTYSVYTLSSDSTKYTKIESVKSGSNLLFTVPMNPDNIVEVRLVEDDTSYNTFYFDSSDTTDTGYIYASADNCVQAYASNNTSTMYVIIADNTARTNGSYVSVNQSTYIMNNNSAAITGGEIYSVAHRLADIDYSTLSWFVYKNGTWTKLATDYSEEENLNIGARADTVGEGLYVLMAKNSSTGTAKALTDLTYKTSPDTDGQVTVSFKDANTNTKYYNIYYSSKNFTSATEDGVLCKTYNASDGTSLLLNLYNKESKFYIAVEAVMENGSKTALQKLTVETAAADSDGDGIPDWYCNKYLLWPADGTEKDIANSDDDADGLTNLEEYIGGSDPKNLNDPVYTANIPVEGIKVSLSSYKMLINKTKTITATISPNNASDKSIVWVSDDEGIATVTAKGASCVIKAVGTGTTVINAVTEDGGYAATCTVTVYCNHSYSTSWTVDTPATTSSSGSKSHHCTICGDKKDITIIPRINSCELSSYSYFCDGKAKTPAVTVKDYNGNKLTVNKDYKLTYSSSTRAAAGSYNVLITFMGDYSGTRTLYYSIYSTVKNLRKTESDLSMVSLTWDALTGASGYKVYRKLSSDTSYKQIATVKTTAFTDKSVSVNKEYYYVVRPYNSYAVGTDSYSVYFSTIIGVPSIYVYVSDTGTLEIDTYKSSNSSGYELFRATSETGKYSLIKSSSYSTYYDTSLTVGKTYYYKARSVALVNGKKYYSNYSTVKYATAGISTPSYPKVSVSGETSLRLSWEAMPGVTGYYIYRSESSYGSYNYIGTTTGTAYTDKNLTTGKYYYYKISAYTTVSGNKIFSSMSSYSSAAPSFTYPYNVSVTNSSLTTHTVSWAKPTGAKGVELSVSVGNSSSYNVVGEFTSSSYTNKNVDYSLTYYYKLRSYRIVSGEKQYSGYTTISYRSLLPQVTGLKATNLSASSIRLSWNKVSNATIYYVYRSSSLNGSYYMVGSTESTKYDITDLTLDTRHFYKVEARRSVNGITNYGIVSKPVSKVVLIPATAITSIKNVSSTSMKIAWKKVDGATSYSLYRSTSKSSGYSLVKSGITSTSYTDTKLTYGKTYYYKLKTVYTVSGIANVSDLSSYVSKKVVLVPPSLTAAANSLTSIKLTWTKDTGVTGYEIYRSASSGGKYTRIKVITKASTYTYTDTSLTAGKTYYYKIRTYKTVNKKNVYSSLSGAAYAKASPPAVTGIKASGITTSSVKLSWNAASGAKYYKIEQYNSSTKKWAAIKTVSSTSYTVTKLTAGTIYYFRITAIDSTKKISGKASSTFKTSTLTAAPTIKLASTKSKTATVSWNSVKGAKSYIVYQSSDGKTWTKAATTAKTSYTITNLTGGKRIYVKVRAGNAYKLYSAYSATKYVTVMK
ncbi:MAG: fibronectin type III domain-containing protein [Acutalibacteraceae bacterium]